MRKGLGKGLDTLFSEDNPVSIESGVTELKITQVEPNANQPRKNFDNEKLEILAESIKEHGLIQPIIVVKNKNGNYTIVAGERRWRAAKKAGLATVSAVVKDYTDRTVTEVALIENLQREDLNPIEEAQGYKSLMEEYSLTQEEISKRIGKSRSAIANSLRLLSLEDNLQKYLISGQISEGHARAILSLNGEVLREFLLNRIIDEDLNVRQAEKLAKDLQIVREEKPKAVTATDIEIEKIKNRLEQGFGTKVKIHNGASKGKIEIEYYGNDDLERILSLFNI